MSVYFLFSVSLLIEVIKLEKKREKKEKRKTNINSNRKPFSRVFLVE